LIYLNLANKRWIKKRMKKRMKNSLLVWRKVNLTLWRFLPLKNLGLFNMEEIQFVKFFKIIDNFTLSRISTLGLKEINFKQTIYRIEPLKSKLFSLFFKYKSFLYFIKKIYYFNINSFCFEEKLFVLKWIFIEWSNQNDIQAKKIKNKAIFKHFLIEN
jgi:hypothetical protein